MIEKLSSDRINELKGKLLIPAPEYPHFGKLIIDGIDVHEYKYLKNIPGEEFRRINGLYGDYYVSNFGRVKSSDKILDIYYEGNYLDVAMVYIPKNDEYTIHRLIMESFLPFEGMEKYHVHHINNNALDTNINNLMWVGAEDHALIHKEYNIIIGEISHSIYQNNMVKLIFYFNNSDNDVNGSELYKIFPNTYKNIIQDNIDKLIQLNVIKEKEVEKGKCFKKRQFEKNRKWLTIAST